MTELEKKAYAYVTDRQKDPNYPTYNWETEISDAYEQGYKDAIDKVCKLIFEYNKRQAKRFGAKSMMRLPDYTINVGDFRKIMEDEQ